MSATAENETLPLVRAIDLEEPDHEHHWLVESLLPRSGVSICGGAPKCCKSWLGLDVSLSVASGTPCLGRFPVAEPGSALIYLAEDPPSVVRDRLAGLCRHRGLALGELPIDVITVPSLRLDIPRDQERLAETLRRQKPRLLLLDPFVRLHRIRENDAGDVSALLAYLRELQRANDISILIIHHARKSGTAGGSSGQGLRGSGDFYAFVDSLLYLRRHREQLLLSVEHRSAAAPAPLEIGLTGRDDYDLHLEPSASRLPDDAPPRPSGRNFDAAILRALDSAGKPLSRTSLRAALHCRIDHLDEALPRLAASGTVVQTGDTWARAARTPSQINAHCAA